MIDDFKQVPERQPSRLDTARSFRPRIEPLSSNPSTGSPEQADPQIIRPAPSFRTPEQAAMQGSVDHSILPEPVASDQHDFLMPGADTEGSNNKDDKATTGITAADATASTSAGKPATPAKTVKLFKRWEVSRKKLIIASSLALVLLLAGGAAFAMNQDREPAKPAAAAKKKVVVPPPPPPIVSPLTGVVVTAEQRDLPVTGVMIENSPNARPQSGLKDAGIVFEAIAEYGITRFLTLFQEAQPGNIGPIRSARPYYLDWAMAFDASYAHVGGSPDALARIKELGVKDMDQFFNPSAYRRITTRFAPHNVYSGVDQLTALGKSKGYEKSTFTPLVRKADKPFVTPAPAPAAAATGTTGTTAKPKSTASKPVADTRTAANVINLGISSALYNASYQYDAATNSYMRTMGGAPHIDANSNTQITPKVVIALAMPYSLMADGYHSQYGTVGSGAMSVFQDGTVTTGTWSKADPKAQFVFKDAAGKDIALNAGQTWISVVADPGKITYQ